VQAFGLTAGSPVPQAENESHSQHRVWLARTAFRAWGGNDAADRRAGIGIHFVTPHHVLISTKDTRRDEGFMWAIFLLVLPFWGWKSLLCQPWFGISAQHRGIPVNA
jgi:hypothetical protein